jgi:DNA-binding NarL/FixJ family response regulator
MDQDRGIASPVAGDRSMQPSVVLLGNSLQFSDHMLKFLGLEFPEVRFQRVSGQAQVIAVGSAPSLIILHEGLPDLVGRIDEIRRSIPDVMVAIACSDVARFRRTGIRYPLSYLHLNAQVDVWCSVLRLLLCGQRYVPVDMMIEHDAWSDDRHAADADTTDDSLSDAQLTPRELQILPLIARGLQNKIIAGELGLSEHTVKLHTHNIFSKLKVSNRTGAASWYLSRFDGAEGRGAHVR